MKQPVKNVLRGVARATEYAVSSVLIPYLSFRYLRDLNVGGFPISVSNEQYDTIIFWITAIGLITVAAAFGVGSSPKRTPRKAVFLMIQTVANCIYIYSYKFSGAADYSMAIVGFGTISFSVGALLNLWMGVIFLKTALNLYDFIDAIIFQKKQKKLRLEQDTEGEKDVEYGANNLSDNLGVVKK
jgi:hypothetical protein